MDGVDGIRTGIHVCRGNWSRKEEVLLEGDYSPLVPFFARLKVTQLVLEYATPRAGHFDVVGRNLGGKEIGLGVVNPRTETIETPAEIVRRVLPVLRHVAPERIFLNPDCGFGCFANRCVNDETTAVRKLSSIVEAARTLRARHG